MTVPTSRWSAAASRPATAPCLACRPVASAAELAAHFRIRHRVFVIEQGLFRNGSGGPGNDRDLHDDDPATIHVIGLADGVIGGTVRLYPFGAEGRWKGDRLAVLPEHRRHGLGAPLVRFAVAEAGARGGREMEAYIQPANVTFFEGLGWWRIGGIVRYAGIDHQRMVTGLAVPRQPGPCQPQGGRPPFNPPPRSKLREQSA
jgi:putative N-acetyltransferase (TIGR04045 family)